MMAAKVNTSGSGQISLAEFKERFRLPRMEPWMQEFLSKVRVCLSEARCGLPLEEVFRRLDRLETADGALSRAEFDRMILAYAPELSPPQLHRLFALVNTSGSGRISFLEFQSFFWAC
mmetsp:Transcript_16365/g.38380  ORF Transcript_16365/g.38380 Transcript_16365/m.38380 type:complete len:118 (+) Transcript_16365:71-424(+)